MFKFPCCWLVKLGNTTLWLACLETAWMNISKLLKHLSGIALTGFVVWQNFWRNAQNFSDALWLLKMLQIYFFTFSVLYHLCSPAQDLPRQTQSYLRCCCFCSGQGDPAIWKCIFLHPMTINNCVIVTPIWTEEGNWVIFHLATHIKSQSEANCCLLVHLLPFKASGNKNWEVWSSNIQKCWLVTSLLKRNEIHLEPKQSVLLKKVFGKITFKSVYLVQMLVVSSGDRRRDGQVAVRGEMVLGLDAGGPVEVHTGMANTQTLHCNVNILRIKTSSWQKDLDC